MSCNTNQAGSESNQASGLSIVPNSLHLRSAQTIPTGARCKSGMGFVELIGDRNSVGISDPVSDNAYMIAVQLKDCPDFDLYAENRVYRHKGFAAGAVAIYDLRMDLIYDLRPGRSCDPDQSFHAIDFYLPHAALNALAEDARSPRIDELRHTPAGVIEDPVAANLLKAMAPTLAAKPDERSALFVDHLAMALASHVARSYGGMKDSLRLGPGRLAPWQERTAKDMLDQRLDGSISLAELSAACKLSVRQFTRAFRESLGASPIAWQRQRRIDKAKGLLASSKLGIADIASACGFADQSHFTRVFRSLVGIGPGAWRRIYRQ
jgi:AraC family transcriptional regulator